jgi:hypothetical protein
MRYTKHIKEKMSQRGISKDLLEIVLIYGTVKQDKVILNKKRCLKILRKIDNYNKKIKRVGNQIHKKNLSISRSIILKILDKGGLTLVIVGETLITTYNTNIRFKKRRKAKRKKK